MVNKSTETWLRVKVKTFGVAPHVGRGRGGLLCVFVFVPILYVFSIFIPYVFILNTNKHE